MNIRQFFRAMFSPKKAVVVMSSRLVSEIKDMSSTDYVFIFPAEFDIYRVEKCIVRFSGTHDNPMDVEATVTDPLNRTTTINYADEGPWWTFNDITKDRSSYFKGMTPSGKWVVSVIDYYAEDVGQVREVSLEFELENKLAHPLKFVATHIPESVDLSRGLSTKRIGIVGIQEFLMKN
jgi:subtilisin-like proprotein convertase family protein